MYPIILKFGPLNIFGIEIGPFFIYTYGLFVALGFLGALISSAKIAKKENISEDIILDICLWIIIFSIIGARIFYIILNFSYYIENPFEMLQIYKGGLVFYGGLIAGILISVWYTNKNKLPLFKIADILAPGIALGQGFGRIGCFFRGCCYGKQTQLPWGITFPDDSLAAYLYGNNHKIHPSQIYEAMIDICIFIFLWFYTKKKKFTGQIFLLYLILYGIGRIFTESTRGDIERGLWGYLSTSQIMSFILIIIASGMYIYLFKKEKKCQ
ncbi:prolipoprotein diacylglyceryl transferase [Candidatus Desantisbacteria bacterium]|nr:prolipoprotein diacylglyceryl transferase [Candidatus Desantisbacteria bacterium]